MAKFRRQRPTDERRAAARAEEAAARRASTTRQSTDGSVAINIENSIGGRISDSRFSGFDTAIRSVNSEVEIERVEID